MVHFSIAACWFVTFRSYVAHDSPIEGLGFAIDGFNGLIEFKRRPDAMKAFRHGEFYIQWPFE
jgi:hypothetical protein